MPPRRGLRIGSGSGGAVATNLLRLLLAGETHDGDGRLDAHDAGLVPASVGHRDRRAIGPWPPVRRVGAHVRPHLCELDLRGVAKAQVHDEVAVLGEGDDLGIVPLPVTLEDRLALVADCIAPQITHVSRCSLERSARLALDGGELLLERDHLEQIHAQATPLLVGRILGERRVDGLELFLVLGRGCGRHVLSRALASAARGPLLNFRERVVECGDGQLLYRRAHTVRGRGGERQGAGGSKTCFAQKRTP